MFLILLLWWPNGIGVWCTLKFRYSEALPKLQFSIHSFNWLYIKPQLNTWEITIVIIKSFRWYWIAPTSTRAAHTFAVSLYNQLSNVVQLQAEKRWESPPECWHCIVCGRHNHPGRFQESLCFWFCNHLQNLEQKLKTEAQFHILTLASSCPTALVMRSVVS